MPDFGCLDATLHNMDYRNYLTGCEQFKGETLEYMDRQDTTDCRERDPAGALTGFYLTSASCSGEKEAEFQITCAQIPYSSMYSTNQISTYYSWFTRYGNCEDVVGKTNEWFDRHDAICNSNEVLMFWKMTNDACSNGQVVLLP